jgi:LysM repeat protein
LNYTVVSGDTLGSIAGSQHSGICNIATANNIQNINLIEIGQVLIIPTGCTNIDNTTCAGPAPVAASATCVAGLPNSYTVVSGDTTSKIAADFNITLDGLLAANPAITNPDAIQVGQVINIPVCPNSQCDIVGTYIVQSGDLYYDLATKYTTTVGQIKSLNPQVDPTKLAVGQTIILPQNCHNLTSATA